MICACVCVCVSYSSRAPSGRHLAGRVNEVEGWSPQDTLHMTLSWCTTGTAKNTHGIKRAQTNKTNLKLLRSVACRATWQTHTESGRGKLGTDQLLFKPVQQVWRWKTSHQLKRLSALDTFIAQPCTNTVQSKYEIIWPEIWTHRHIFQTVVAACSIFCLTHC